jgi:hypothetical protein
MADVGDPALQSVLTRLTTVLESFQTSMAVGGLSGQGSAQMRPGSVWSPATSIAGAFGEIPGAIAGTASMFMGQNGMMGGLAQGGNFSGLQFSQWQREMSANTLSRSMSMEATLGRYGLERFGGMAATGMQMMNMVDPEIGRGIDSVMSFAAGNTHLSASGLAAVDQYSRMGGAVPGSTAYELNQKAVTAFATSGGVLKDGTRLAGRSADHRAAMAIINGGVDDSLNRNFGLAGAIQELQSGLGWDMGRVLEASRTSGKGSLQGLAAEAHVYGNLSTMSGGRLAAGVQMIDRMGANGNQFMGLIARGGVANAGGMFTGVSEAVLDQVAMSGAVKVAGSLDLKTAQHMAEVNPKLYAEFQQAIARGDTVGAERMLQEFRSGANAGGINTSNGQRMAELDRAAGINVTTGLDKIGLRREALDLGGSPLANRLANLSQADAAAILKNDLSSVAGFSNDSTRDLLRRSALAVGAGSGADVIQGRLEAANKTVEESGKGTADTANKIEEHLKKIIAFVEGGKWVDALREILPMLQSIMQGNQVPGVTVEPVKS